MPIKKDDAKDAIKRFYCPITYAYPSVEQMCFVETLEGKEGKEVAELHVFAREQINLWSAQCKKVNGGKITNPATKLEFRDEPFLIPGQQLFSLVLAIVEASGHLPAVIAEDEDFAAFSQREDYQAALVQGRILLMNLEFGEGVDLQTRIQSLRMPDLQGSRAQIRFLEDTLKFKLGGFAEPADLPPPIEAKVDVLIPPQVVMRFVPMLDPTPPFGAAPIAAAYNEEGELARALAASQDQDLEMALAVELSLHVQAPHQDEDPELKAALEASLAEQKGPADNALAMRLNQVQQVYEGGEYKSQADADHGFLARLDMGIPINIANDDITLLRKMLERIKQKMLEALAQSNERFVNALLERHASISAYIDGERRPAQQPVVLPAAKAAGVGLNPRNNVVNPPAAAAVPRPVVAAPQPVAAPQGQQQLPPLPAAGAVGAGGLNASPNSVVNPRPGTVIPMWRPPHHYAPW